MKSPFFKRRADDAAHYRRDGDFVMILSSLPDDVIGPQYHVVRTGESQPIYGIRGPKGVTYSPGDIVFMRYLGGSHYYPQLEGLAGGTATTSILSSLPEDGGVMEDFVARIGSTLSGTLDTEDLTLEVNFVDGLLVFRQAAGISEQGGDLELSSAIAGQWGLSELTHHKTRHQNGGADEINVGGLNGLLADAQTPLAHKTTHQDGGSDEMNVGGLSGLLADPQAPLGHYLTHENDGEDEINVGGLSGELADPQTPKTHAATHQDGGSDAISLSCLTGQAAEAQKIAVRRNYGSDVGPRPRLHLSEGANIALSVTDNEEDDEIIVLISATGEAAQTPPGGSDGQVQFNDNGSFGGNESFLFDDTAGALQLSAKTAEAVPLKIKLAASATGDGLELVDSNDNVLARINETGFLGIGGDPFTALYVQGNTAANSSLMLYRSAASAASPLIYFIKDRPGSTSPAANDALGTIDWGGYDGSDLRQSIAYITCKIGATPGAGDMPTYIIFNVTPEGSTTAAEALRIHQAGYLVSAPTYSNNVGAVRAVLVNSSGVIGVNTSSKDFKENIVYLSDETKPEFSLKSLDWVKALEPVRFDYKDANSEAQRGLLGLIAEDVEKVNPKLVSYANRKVIDGYEEGPNGGKIEMAHYEETDKVEAVLYQELITPILILLQDALKRIEVLEAGKKLIA